MFYSSATGLQDVTANPSSSARSVTQITVREAFSYTSIKNCRKVFRGITLHRERGMNNARDRYLYFHLCFGVPKTGCSNLDVK